MPQADPRFTTDLLIPSDTAEARRVQEQIDQLLKVHQFGEREVFGIRLAVEEALVNAIKHGNQMDPSRKVRVAFHVSQEKFEVMIADEGAGFDFSKVPDPTDPTNIEKLSGRGLFLIRTFMDNVSHNRVGNEITLIKRRRARLWGPESEPREGLRVGGAVRGPDDPCRNRPQGRP